MRRIAVLMPVYNAEKYLRESINSILNQSYSDFDFYIINDGSTDMSEEIINEFNDARIIYLKNERNLGLIRTLNRGLDIIENEYIVRMDADDIAMPERFAKQIKFMDQNPEVVASGTQITYFGGMTTTTAFPTNHRGLKAKLVFAPGLNHPTVIVRNSIIQKHNLRYDTDYPIIEDYEFWLRVSRFGELANLSDSLLKYRWEGQNITARTWSERNNRYKLVYTKVLTELNINPDEQALLHHLELSFNTDRIENIRALYQHSKTLLNQNKLLKIYPEVEFNKEIQAAWDRVFFKAADDGIGRAFQYWLVSGRFKWKELKYILARVFTNNKVSH